MVTTFSVAMVAALLPQSDPMIELKAVYPYADPLCAAVSANGTLGFVAEGAGISVVKLDGTCANVPRTPLDGSIWAIEPYGEQLFIAGGTMGLFELPICTSDLLNCEACDGWGIGSPAPLADPPGDKVCIDVAVDGPNDKLYALFSAEDATDLYTYDLAAISQGPVISGQPSTIDGRGYAIAVDPTDADHVYVAMGEGGFARVTLSTQAWDQGPILDEEPWQMTSCDGGQVVHPASVRDLSIAVVDSGAGQKRFLYAAADRSGLVEIDLDVTWRQIMDYERWQLIGDCEDLGFEWGYRVSTVTDGEENVLIAVAGNTLPGEYYELGPSTSVGHWESNLATYPSNCSLGEKRLPRLYLYKRQGNALPTYTTSFVTQSNGDPAPWRSLTVRKQGSSYIAYEGRTDGLHVFDLGTNPFTPPTSPPPTITSYVGKGAAHLDGVASTVNPNVLYFGNDRLGGELVGMIQVDGMGQLTPIEGTSGLCESSGLELECNSEIPVELDCGVMEQPSCVSLLEPPNPFMNGLLGEAHWKDPDPNDGSREWFVAGTGSLARQVGCIPEGDCVEGQPLPGCNHIANPCLYTNAWCPEANPCINDRSIWDRPDPDQPGWLIVQMKTLNTSGLPVTRTSLRTRWWQMESPDDTTLQGDDDFGRQYFNSANDVREESDLVHLFRSGTRQGYVLVDRSQVMDLALGIACPATGRGQFLELEDIDEIAVTTHFEVPVGGDKTGALTVRGESFQVETEEGTQYLVGIAAGSVVNGPNTLSQWQSYMTQPMAVFYNVTNADPVGGIAPQLAAIALGDEDDGLAVAVCTMTVEATQTTEEKTYAFVADFVGRVWTFDVSASVLEGFAMLAPLAKVNPVNALSPIGVWTVPTRAFDRKRPNILDLEIDGTLLYVANVCRGITILDASNIDPLDPEGDAGLKEISCSPIDTPGLAEGIALRVEDPAGENPITTIVVGDTRGGMRLYGRQECSEE